MMTESTDTNRDLTTVSPQAFAIAEETSLPEVHLPEPDPENITVLTQNLPNTPILPWNQYDSPGMR
ncbi:MAG: hypothetical protein HC890_03785 [Chloroflexaceae bacterium]|nr:hypothetical protein [Chloroflexaceae bacterium]